MIQRRQLVVIGGGIAGVSCTEELIRIYNDRDTDVQQTAITLISADEQLKVVKSSQMLGEYLEEIEIGQTVHTQWLQQQQQLQQTNRVSVRVIIDSVVTVDTQTQNVHTKRNEVYHYDELCIATGGRPHFITPPHERVIAVRDTDSVQRLSRVLESARRIMVVGNGGIGLEMAYALRKFNVTWVIRDQHVGDVFLDREASAFILPRLFPEHDPPIEPLDKRRRVDPPPPPPPEPPAAPSSRPSSASGDYHGASLGPTWLSLLAPNPTVDSEFHRRGYEGHTQQSDSLSIRFGCWVKEVNYHITNTDDEKQQQQQESWPVEVTLTNATGATQVFGCDYMVCATGVEPNASFLPDTLTRGPSGGIAVNELMETSCAHVYAAGDVADAVFDANATSPNWFQMRLWSQAKIMGIYCARRMSGEYDELGFFFELFTHVTQFFGTKVVLLGRYNAQGIDPATVHTMVRCKPGVEFIKLVLVDWRLVGAVLIGDTDLEETFENVILNKLDLSPYGDDLLDPQIDLADYFD